jgi:hypothetical protein
MKRTVATTPAAAVSRRDARAAPIGRAASPGAIADAIGHCLLVFTFVPALTVVPGWLLFESGNALNVREPIVLSFVLLRGVHTVLDAFYAGIVPGVLSGIIDGLLVCVWLRTGHGVPTRARLYAGGAICGTIAAGLMIGVVAAQQLLAGAARTWGAGAVAFEIGSGLACGALAMPTAARLLRGEKAWGESDAAST